MDESHSDDWNGLSIIGNLLHNRLLADMNMGGKFRSFLLEITRKNNWIVTLTIGAVFELYSAFRLDHISGNDLESK